MTSVIHQNLNSATCNTQYAIISNNATCPGQDGDGFLHSTLARIGGNDRDIDVTAAKRLCWALTQQLAGQRMTARAVTFIEYTAGSRGINDPLGEVTFEREIHLLL